jgi:hypothetical protein
MGDDYMCPNCVTPWKCNEPHILPGECERCGYPADSFACKIRHLSMNTDNLRREREQ